MTEVEIKAMIHKIILDDPGITDYAILAKLVKTTDYEYTNSFHSILYKIASDNDIRINKNQYYPRYTLSVPIKIESKPPYRNCYRCECLKKVEDLVTIGISDDHDHRGSHSCALNPVLRFEPSMNYIPRDCPINNALPEQQLKEKGC